MVCIKWISYPISLVGIGNVVTLGYYIVHWEAGFKLLTIYIFLSIDEINPYGLGNEWITGRKWCVFSYAKTVVQVCYAMNIFIPRWVHFHVVQWRKSEERLGWGASSRVNQLETFCMNRSNLENLVIDAKVVCECGGRLAPYRRPPEAAVCVTRSRYLTCLMTVYSHYCTV
jgi:hypothetical protein